MEKEAVIGTMSDSRQYQSYGAIPSGVPPNTVNVHRNTIVIVSKLLPYLSPQHDQTN